MVNFRALMVLLLAAGPTLAQSSWNGTQYFNGPVLNATDLNSGVAYSIAQGQAQTLAALQTGQQALLLLQLNAVTGIDVGSQNGVASIPFVDFHVDGTGADYNARLIASTFAGATGQVGFDLKALAARFVVDGTLRAGRQTAGQGDNGAVAAFIANSGRADHGGEAGVMGYVPGLNAAFYPDIDSVGLYLENTGRAPFFVLSNATFVMQNGTARIVPPSGQPLTPAQVAQMFRGMQVLTNHTVPWTAWIDTWAPDGTWVQVSGGFTHLGGSATVGQDPTGSAVQGGGVVQIAFAPLTKVWVQNANCYLGVNTSNAQPGPFGAKKCTGIEFGMINNTGTDHAYDGQEANSAAGYSWGVDAVNLGANRGGSAHIARGNWDAGFHTQVAGRYGFLAETGFGTGLAFAVVGGPNSPAPLWSVDYTGTMIGQRIAVSNMLTCSVETRPGYLCRNLRVVEIN